MQSGLTVVNIFYADDLEFMLLQAKSFTRYVAEDLFSHIILIENYIPADRQRVRQQLLAAYGKYADRVTFYTSDEICPLPVMDGWLGQQVLKLAASRKVTTSQYMLMDTKNHFVRNTSGDDFFAPSGLPYLHMPSFKGHPLELFLVNSVSYWGLDPAKYLEDFCQTITPFIMYTDLVKDMLVEFEARHNITLPEFMIQHKVTEFYVYGGYIVSKFGDFNGHYEKRYGAPGQPAKVIWAHMNNFEDVVKIITESEKTRHPVFAVHRTAFRGMPLSACKKLVNFWIEHNVFSDQFSAWSFIFRQKIWLQIAAIKNLFKRIKNKLYKLWAKFSK